MDPPTRTALPTPRSPRLATLVACLVSCVALLPGCSGDGDAEAPREILVSAASSLTDAFTEIGATFETTRPGIRVRLNPAGSSTLRAQILEGVPVDVFAAADDELMTEVAAAGALEGEAHVFALNSLQIAVPHGNPAGVRGLADLARDELLVGLCAEAVPCGRFAHRILDRAGVTPAPDTSEPNVRALLTKVELGELDAALTYRTDVEAAAGVDGLEIPDEVNVVAEYPIAVLREAPHPETARAFVAFVLSPEGRAILARHGFVLP